MNERDKKVYEGDDVMDAIGGYLVKIMDESKMQEPELHLDVYCEDGRIFHLSVKRVDQEQTLLKNKN